MNKQKREEAFDDVNNEGNVEMKEQLIPNQAKREQRKLPQVGERVKSMFVTNEGKTWFEGVIEKVNEKTYRVKFDDGDINLMKKNEVKLSDEINKPLSVGDKVKSQFLIQNSNKKSHQWFEGVVESINPKMVKVKFNDGDVLELERNKIKKI